MSAASALPLSRRAAVVGAGILAAAPAAAAECPGAMSRARYEAYIAAFNARDIPGFTRFYAPDVVFQLGPREMRGRQAIVDWYDFAWKRVREETAVRRFIADPGGVAVELETQFTAIADWPDFSAGPLRPGDVLRRIGFVHYDGRSAGFTRVATAPHKVLLAPAHWEKTR